MRTAWILPVAFHSILAFAEPAAEVEEVDIPVYGNIKLTYATPSPSSVSLNLVERGASVYGDIPLTFATPSPSSVSLNHGISETGSCLTKPTDLHTKSRTRARSHIRSCGESGGTCLPSSTGPSSHLAAPSSKPVVSTVTDYTTTVVTTIYETYCPGTSTVTKEGTTYPVEYPSSSKVTETYTTVYPVTSYVTVPASKAVQYETESTVYETVIVSKTTVVPCSGTTYITSGSVVKTSVYPSSSIVTEVETSKVSHVVSYETTKSVESSVKPVETTSKAVPSSYVPVTYTTETTYYVTSSVVKTVTVPCSGTTTITSESSTWTSLYPSSSVATTTELTKVPVTSPVTVVSSSAVVPSTKAVPTTSEGDYKTTVYTTVYTTTCPGTTTIAAYGTTFTKTYDSSSVVTETVTSSYKVSETSAASTKSKHAHGHHSKSAAASSTAAASSSCVSKSLKSKSASTGFVSSTRPASSRVASASVSSKASSAVASSSATKSKTSSACSKPTEEAECIPCEGQPGSDPKKFCGLTIDDNSYTTIPKTCRTVVYDFEITNTTIAPDGIERLGLLVNGEMPGPTIEANWGDTIIVHVHNKLANNGTSIHFHGTRQNYTNEMDGTTSITQCPIAPGDSYTYKFVATNYGHSWYHSHFALQTYNGVFGPMIVHGPTSAPYDVDAGILSLQDWSHDTVDMQFPAAQTVGSFPQNGPRVMDTGLINGLNEYEGKGERYVLENEFEVGKSYLLRIVNVANQATFKFQIDNHTLEVISADYVPIKPYKTNIVNISPGQRYTLIVKADQAPGSYWIRSDNQNTCNAMTYNRDVKAIVNYKGYDEVPTTTAVGYTDECVDEPLASLIPYVPMDAGAQDKSVSETVLIGPGPQTPNLYKWTLNGSTFVSRWNDPSLWELSENGTIPDYAGSLQLTYPKLGEWVYMVIQSPIPLPHPIHYHGHDFLVVGAGLGFYTGQALNMKNPPRRDTALMPASATSGGYLVIAWETDNPGSWLMHCHVGFHAAMGFTMEIIEGEPAAIKDTITDSCQLDKTCKAWNKYASAAGIADAGI